MNIETLFVLGILFLLGYALWQHANVGRSARRAAMSATKKHGLLLLDQSVILKRLRLRASKRSMFTVERLYEFEFSSTGNRRYKGALLFHGGHLTETEMDVYQI